MPFYYPPFSDSEQDKRIADRLLAIKEGLKEQGVPPKNLDESLLLATWNIRELDSNSHGRRSEEPLMYIAEILSSFDLIAVQEIRDQLEPFKKVMSYLGDYWKFIITDVTLGTRGNVERMAFIYDTRKIQFEGLAGEIVIPPIERGRTTIAPAEQLYRTPYLAAFKSGWFKFCICTVHIKYGKNQANNPEREREIREVAQILARLQRENQDFGENMILLGDFNIFRPTDITFQAITDSGFHVPEQLRSLPSNALKNRFYDQIAFISQQQMKTIRDAKAGVFDFFQYVYREDEEELYLPEMGDAYWRMNNGNERNERQRFLYYRNWRTYRMSDHLVMWLEMKTDFGAEYLKKARR